ncbi:MAG TPA: hypothetical protein PLH64_04510 [Anaerolineaceae bacterium]|nr:hypothetical protein [Anaerolineaceae bacterium]
MDKWKTLLGSRKFWATLVGLVFMIIKVVKPDFPLDGDQLAGILALLVSYILGTALEDGLRSNK